MDFGELLTRWTVRLAVALYLFGLVLRVRARGRQPWLTWARLAWSGGLAVFLLHVACAFQFYHHWSHQAAYEATAQRTGEVVGLAWGGGLYANYAFVLVWSADVCWWWGAPRNYPVRPGCVEWLVQGFLAFIVLNATVVFAVGVSRWLGLVGCLLLIVILGCSVDRRTNP